MGELFTGPKRRVRRTTWLAIASGAFVGGVALARQGIDVPLVAALVFGFAALVVYRRHSKLFLVAIAVALILLGVWRGSCFMQQNAAYEASYDQKVSFRATVLQDSVYGKNGQLTADVGSISFLSPVQKSVRGRIKVSGFGEQMLYRGDVVTVAGTLRRTLGGKQGQISYAQLHVEARSNDMLHRLRRTFAAGMLNAVPDPEASFGLGLLIGQRTTLPDSVNDQLSTVGLTHIVAVSGYNLTIIMHAIQRLMARRSKYQTMMFTSVLMLLFLLVTGFSASIVRAALVSGLSLLAWYYGRSIKPLVLIGIAAATTAAWSPYYVWSDIGWYLSFLAFFGVIVIAPLVQDRLYGNRQPGLLQQVLLETLAAQVMTMPLILYVFQQLSIVAIFSNVLVVPAVPIAMLLALVAGMAGMLIPSVAGWLAWPAQVILTYMLDVAAVLSRVPHAVAHVGLTASGLLVTYAIILGITAVLWHTNRRKHAIITDIPS